MHMHAIVRAARRYGQATPDFVSAGVDAGFNAIRSVEQCAVENATSPLV